MQKISNQDDGPNDKRRKVATGRIMGSTAASRRRQAGAVVANRQDAVVGGNAESVNEELESVKVEFTKEEVDVLLNEKIRAKKFDLKVSFIIYVSMYECSIYLLQLISILA